MKRYIVSCLAAASAIIPSAAIAEAFVDGRYYSSNSAPAPDPLDVEPLPTRYRLFHYDAAGSLLFGPRYVALDVGVGENDLVPRGIAFGPDNLLYVVNYRFFSSTYTVIALDSDLDAAQATYTQFNTNIGGNASFGKIIFEPNGRFYVCAGDGVTRFQTGEQNARTRIWSEEGVFGMSRLPNGNLVIVENDEMVEITEDGDRVRTFTVDDPDELSPVEPDLRGLRDVLYHPGEDALYVSLLGFSTFFDRILKMDPATGDLLAITSYESPDDLSLLASGDILMGSNGEPPVIFDADLNIIDVLDQDVSEAPQPRPFVAQYPAVYNSPPPPPVVPRLMVEALAGGGVSISWPSLPDHTYVVQGTNDLAIWEAISPPIPGTGADLSFDAAPFFEKRIVRVKVTRD